MATQHYHGSCQCGAVAFEADVDLDNTITCNCSRCQRLGSVLAFAPQDGFTLLRGEDQMTEYLFNKHVVHHLFCKTCGIEGFARGKGPDGKEMVAVNVNCLAGVDPRALQSKHYNGRDK